MRISSSLCVTALLLLPTPAWADFIGSAFFNQGTLNGDFMVTSFTTVCSPDTTSSPLGCSGSLLVGAPGSQGFGNFIGLAEATGSTSGALSIGSGISMDVWRVNPPNNPFGSGDRYFAAGSSDSVITDTVAILNAGAITNGFLRLTFDVEGSITRAVDTITLDGFDPTTPTSGFPFTSSSAFLLANGASRVFSGPGVVTLDVPLLFGTDQALTLKMNTSAAANMLFSEGYRIINDFSNTATLANAAILDANLQLVDGATLFSSSGLEYGSLTAPPPAPIPEPTTISLLALGLGAAVRYRRRAQSRP